MIIEDSVVIVTGGANGLGKAMTEKMLKNNAKVVVLDIDQKALDDLKREIPEVTVYNCNITDEKQISETILNVIEKFSKIDILINNAGIIYNEPIFNLIAKNKRHNIEEWSKVIDTNLTSVFLMSSYVIEQMVMKRTKGLIINISSICAKGNEGQSAYSAAKAGVESLTKVWAKELGRYGIRSVAVAPGFMDTKSTHDVLNEKNIEDLQEEILLHKLGNPYDIANAIALIIENNFINGTVVDVNGGMCM